MKELLATHRRVRDGLSAAVVLGMLLVCTQLLFPALGSGPGTPTAILFSGLVQGLLTALTAVGLVFVYRSLRVINFAQTAIGAAGGELTFQLLELTRTPWPIAIALGVAVAGAVGLIFDLTLGRRFFRAPRVVMTTATIAVAALLSSVSDQAVNRLPFFKPVSERTLVQLSGAAELRKVLPFSSWSFDVGHLRLPFGFAELLAIGVSLAAIIGVTVFLRVTSTGVAVRAMAENTERTSLLGVSTGKLSSTVWVIAALLSGVGLILTGVISTPAAASGTAPEILLPALAAAVIARMSSIPWAVAAAVGIEVAQAAFTWNFQHDAPIFDLLLFLVIGGGLLLQRRLVTRGDDGGGVTWEATQEQRQVPRELREIAGVRLSRIALIVVAILAAVIYPHVVSVSSILLGGAIAISAIMALSVLVLTGWAGQVSLGQYGFAAIGGVVSAALTSKVGLTFWVAVPLGTALSAAIAALVGIPALRIRGLFLAVTTFAFAVAVQSVLFSPRYFGWLLASQVRRPTLFVLDFQDETSMYYLCVAALLVAIVVVTNLRRSRTGRALIASRENPANLETFGISAVRAQLTAFAISGALAGFGGAMLVHLVQGVGATSFTPTDSIDLFLLAVLGGVSSVPGVVLGAIVFNVKTFFLGTNPILGGVEPFLVIALLFIEPAGLIGLVNRARDAVLRIVAQRRQLIVPSLFADQDPDALAARLIPLAPPLPNGGMAALPPQDRYIMSTDLYVGSRLRLFSRKPQSSGSREAALIATAVSMADEASDDLGVTS